MKPGGSVWGAGVAALINATLFSHAALAGALGQGQDVTIPWFRLIAGLGFCILLAYGGALVLRSQNGAGSGLHFGRLASLWASKFKSLSSQAPAPMSVVQTLPIGNRVELVLLRHDGRDYVIATSPTGASILVETSVEKP